jgi:hypothetical protein
MKHQFLKLTNLLLITSFAVFSACSPAGDKTDKQMKNEYAKGTYGFDVNFLGSHNIKTIELKDPGSKAAVLIVPAWQGRVMTSSASGNEGKSFGWINYSYLEAGKKSKQFNPFGGEERLWFGPEGGPFSIYFKKGDEQVFANWVVPKEIDTEGFDLVSLSAEKAAFHKDFVVQNASGNGMKISIDRTVSILGRDKARSILGTELDSSLSFVGYESVNKLVNAGTNSWDSQSGFLSIWMLAMFSPSEKGVVFIPFKTGSESELGRIVTDDYFGKVPAERLIIKDGILFFKTDGKMRGKIGISPERALPCCGSYDPISQTLTILMYNAPEKPMPYVNSKWGQQDDHLSGDAVNSYNDGPVDDGSVMGPFYEIESSSPAAMLAPGSSITHIQRIFHITGSEEKLSLITEKLFAHPVSEIKTAFN